MFLMSRHNSVHPFVPRRKTCSFQNKIHSCMEPQNMFLATCNRRVKGDDCQARTSSGK